MFWENKYSKLIKTIMEMILLKKGQLTLITETVVGFKKHSWTQLDTTLGQRYALLATKNFSSGTVLKCSFEVFDYLTNRLWLQKSMISGPTSPKSKWRSGNRQQDSLT